jgi:putative ABC transport system substrate-binding protein
MRVVFHDLGNAYAASTLKGDKPADRVTRFEMALNLNIAKGLGLTVPNAILVRADEVIE